MSRKPHPFKGIPRSEWPKAKERQLANQSSDKPLMSIPVFSSDPPPLGPMAVAEAPAKEPERIHSRPEAPTAPPKNQFSMFTRKLDTYGDIPGFGQRWFNDSEGGSRLIKAQQSGWSFVSKEELGLNDFTTPLNSDIGSHIRAYAMTGDNGQAIYAYLMKKPLDLIAEHDKEREVYHANIERAIRGGEIGSNLLADDKRYVGGQIANSSIPVTSFDSKLGKQIR